MACQCLRWTSRYARLNAMRCSIQGQRPWEATNSQTLVTLRYDTCCGFRECRECSQSKCWCSMTVRLSLGEDSPAQTPMWSRYSMHSNIRLLSCKLRHTYYDVWTRLGRHICFCKGTRPRCWEPATGCCKSQDSRRTYVLFHGEGQLGRYRDTGLHSWAVCTRICN